MSVFIFIFGLCIGSFLNVVIDRLPKDESIAKGRSHCDYCQKTLAWYELIPLLSYILQRGQSSCCHKKLSLQYPLIELITGVGFITIYLLSYPFPFLYSFFILFIDLSLFCILLVIFMIDLKTFLMPEALIATGCILSIIRGLATESFLIHFIPLSFLLHVILPAFGAFLFFYIIWFYTKGRGMGFGDVELAVLLGLISGYPGIIFTLYIAFLTGATVGVILILIRQKSMKSKLPFGPFLIFGLLGYILFQNQFALWWKGVI
jgi:leader peptidase (prepilin peptidase) / N-methyltransferase